MFANCSMMGMDFGMPDVCLTPAVVPVPIPYPNFSLRPMAIPPTCAMTNLISFMPAHNLASTVPITMGDQGGVMGGVMCGMFMGPARNTLGSFKVFMGGLPATKMLSMSMQNLINVPVGMTLVPAQFKTLVLT